MFYAVYPRAGLKTQKPEDFVFCFVFLFFFKAHNSDMLVT